MRFLLNITGTVILLCLTISFTDGSTFNESSSRGVEEGRGGLVFPTLSIMQFSLCTSSGTPLFKTKKYPFRRLGLNLGFQVNYALPYRLMDFYKPPTWARAMVDIVKGRFMPTEVVTARAFRRRRSNRHLSAGDIYKAVDETLQMAGYEQDCLLKSVCELAHSPLHNVQEDLYAEILQFILTPSEHQGFDTGERKMRIRYEMAEKLGREGADCDLLYTKCSKSFLSDITNFVDESTDHVIF
ncbi:uncharacterized protein LOC6048011 [Culex quinquefasciatus]|uniref:uncharacterized protein LOC6048011 n=1 Tax=Culex quinquefasciatus TaxID=7176 RepID=UPI0018E30B33|nr:uncharacterized protein LOC6048011 [Culex quinquefasciatus]